MNLRNRLFAFSIVLSGLLFGCAKPSDTTHSQGPTNSQEISKWIGKTVRVQFRRDALGAATTLPISPTTVVEAPLIDPVVGTLTIVESDAIVVDVDNRPKWVPREVILFVELNP